MADPTDAAFAELHGALEVCCAELAKALDEAEGGDGTGASTEPSWRPLVLAAPPGLEQLVSIVKPPLQVIIAVLQFVQALLQALAAILLGLPDPFRALILAAYALLKDIIDDLLNAGAYLYADAPGIGPTETNLAETGFIPNLPKDFKAGFALERPPVTPDAFARWAGRFTASFDDPGDDARPVVTDGAPVQAVFIVMAAPSLDALRQALYLIGKLFNISAFKKAFEKYPKGAVDPRRSRVRSRSVKPDWKSARMRDLFPDLEKLRILPEALKSLLLSVDNLAGLIRSLAAAMQDKVQVLLKLAQAVQAVVDLLDALKSAGMYALPVSTLGGVEGLKQAFLQAKNRPPGGYVGGICLLASGPNLAKAALLWEMLGQSPAMELAEGNLTLEDAAKQLAGSKAAQVLEASANEVKDAWGNLKTASQTQADAFLEALDNAPAGFAEAVGRTPQELVDGARRARSSLVEALEQAKGQLPTSENIEAGIAATKQAQRRGGRSLAMGFGGPGPSERAPGPQPPVTVAPTPEAPPDASGTPKKGSGP
ncbi:hypothetical protein D7X74_21005 [Corallococcus sp. CA047B]|uniref:hypothetical protein n=1 Tax=Corallococcus sp. CA047B TaxID=2316729 RepID=UPI000EA0D844|nr:hypothetical protein [Corallococcus sp. CA047B]RKH13886.1 hypothetical protein D7X74_21005 [Corallococcus sp. CA047B]